MTDRELMQMALDALEAALSNDQPYISRSEETAEALRARLAQPDLITPADVEQLARIEKLIDKIDPYEAQPELEPVAQMREMLEVQGRDGTWNYDTYSQGMYNGMEFMVALAEGREPVFREPPERWLHTPPKREWQNLTDEDWIIGKRSADYIAGAEWAEAKLKEKNSAT